MAVAKKSGDSGKAPGKAPEPKGSQERKPPVPAGERFLYRDQAWLEFNGRVLNEAADERNPLLERVNFLAIFSSNLDEFVMKRIGLLKRQMEAGVRSPNPDRVTPSQLFSALRSKIKEQIGSQFRIFSKSILPELEKNGIMIIPYKKLKEDLRKKADEIFLQRIFPVLTPLSVDPGHPFPFISNLSTSLGITLKNPETGEKFFARIKVPPVLEQYVLIDSDKIGQRFVYVTLMDLVSNSLPALFPGMKIQNVMGFRISRNAQVERDEEAAEDLLDLMEEELRQRKFERVIRLEYGANPDPDILNLLLQVMELKEEDCFELPEMMDFTAIREIAALPFPALKNDPWLPQTPKILQDEEADLFAMIRKRDMFFHHPYESFHNSVERFVRTAADDPNVLAIKITLYRTGADSPFIQPLIRAAEAGKQVVALVELKARFDEERNIQLAQALESVGVHVVYGLVGLKTHAKTALVIRREPDGVRCYAHIGTGNYHSQTARLYTDLSLLTCSPAITTDLLDLFHFLTGRSLKKEYKKLLVAPYTMKSRFIELVEKEIANKKAGKPARIIAKMNSLEDKDVIQAFYRASQAGIPVDLIVRGFCCLRPGIPGLSQTIRVISVIGRFLEHSRIFHFADGEENPLKGLFLIGSADLMTRNLCYRVEVISPIEDVTAKARLWEIFGIMLNDQRQAWDMLPDGSYTQRQPKPGSTGPEARGSHRALMAVALGAGMTDDRVRLKPMRKKLKKKS